MNTRCKRGARAVAGVSLVPALLVLIPKCPLCLAAYLAMLGLGAGVAGALAPVLRPLAIMILLLSIGTLVITRRRLKNS